MKSKTSIIITVLIMALSLSVFAQDPPPPNGGNNPNSGNTPVGGGAPIGSGLLILLTMGAAYGSKKMFQLKNKENLR